MEVLISKEVRGKYKVHLINPVMLNRVLTSTVNINWIKGFNNKYELWAAVQGPYTVISYSYAKELVGRLYAIEVWDTPYYNHAKRTMLTFELFNILN